MLRTKVIVSVCAAALVAALNTASAFAQGMVVDSRTEFTFSQPVELPGVTLPPSTYVFRFADATTGRTVMQVFDKNSNKTYGLFLTISAMRPKPSDEAELRFLETPSGTPAAVKTWWYPGNSIGREFIYPKAQARRLAMATNTDVLTTKAENVPEQQMKTAQLEYVSPGGQETAVNEKEHQKAEPAASRSSQTKIVGTSGTNASAASAPAQEAQSASNTTRRRLPRTDTLLPLIALMGVASLAGGASLRFRG